MRIRSLSSPLYFFLFFAVSNCRSDKEIVSSQNPEPVNLGANRTEPVTLEPLSKDSVFNHLKICSVTGDTSGSRC